MLPLRGHELLAAETAHGSSFPTWTGSFMHIAIIPHVDMSYSCVRFSGYMSCHNAPIFSALLHAMQYLFHHSRMSSMYPSKELKKGDDNIITYWTKGQAEYLPSEFGDGLVNFADAGHARDLFDCRSVSASIHLMNGIIISWA